MGRREMKAVLKINLEYMNRPLSWTHVLLDWSARYSEESQPIEMLPLPSWSSQCRMWENKPHP
ncbi:Sentrin-Specific Protease 1 [Manis pentadactyla]|nr:Sentrin-Specific Protease 1 [Manis pentadactyla]